MESHKKALSYGAKSLLVLSLCLNVGLLSALFMRTQPKKAHANLSEWPALKYTSNQKLIAFYEKLSLADLVQELKNEALAEEGFTCSEIALGCLVAFYHFDLARALPTHKKAMRYIAFKDVKTQEQKTLPLFTGLSVGEKEAVFHFAKGHKWPLDSLGLFLELKKAEGISKEIKDASLKNAFFRTKEFNLLKRTLSALSAREKAKYVVDYNELLSVLLEGKWEDTLALSKQIKEALSEDEVIRAFFTFILQTEGDKGSELFLRIGMPIALKRLSDKEVSKLMRLFRTLSKAKVLFATRLLFSPRSDEVHFLAAKLISVAANKQLPTPFDRQEAIKVLFPEA